MSVSAAGRVFYDGFEDGTTNAWAPGSSSGYYAKCDVVTSALDAGVGPASGTHMARCNWDGTQGTYGHRSQEMIKSGWSGDEFLIRWKVRYDSDIDHSIGSKLFRAPGAVSFSANQFENYPDANLLTTIYKSNAQQIGATNWGCGSNFLDGQWHEIEIYFLKSGAGQNNGVARIWTDGSFCWEETGVNTDDPQGSSYWNDFHLMSNWSNNYPAWPYHDANNHAYWDEFEIYSNTGSGGTGSMSAGTIAAGGGDTTPPSSPSGLAAQ